MRHLSLAFVVVAGCATPQATKNPDPDLIENAKLPPKKPAPPPKPMPPPTRADTTIPADPYRWLEDEKADDVKAWMAAQDKFARERIHALPERDALLARYRELYYLDSMGAPTKRGGRYFYVRTHKDKEKAIVYWKQGATGEEKVLLNPNEWSTDNTVSLGTWVPSWDGKKVVFAKKPNAADESTLYVLDVDTMKVSETDVIPGAKYASPSWLPDNKSFIYEWLPTDPTIPISERPGYCEVRQHKLGTDPSKDEQLHPRTGDPKTFIGGGVSRDGKFLFVSIMRGWNENDVFIKRNGVGGKTDKTWQLLVRGKDAKYSIDSWKGKLYAFTDEGAPNKRVFEIDPQKLDRKNWKELIPEDKNAARESMVIVGGHFAIASLRDVVSVVELFTLDGKKVREVELPGLGTSSNLYGDEDDDEAFYSFSSLTMPGQIFRTSVKTGKSELYFKVDVPVDPSKYDVKQVFVTSKDGTKVPMFIVARKDVKLDGKNPTLLYGYGGFDVSMRSSFTSFIYPWLEHGGVYALVNLRGGGEYGKAWHDAGKGSKKQNVFDDFEAAARFLVTEKWTSPKQLGIRGGSNGGLLVGVAMTQHPELYGAVVCAVPLLDMERYHLYGSGKTWIPEYGDPEKPDELGVLSAYSPYQHVKPGTKYPPLLMMSADHDDRVDPFHARKFVAKVQAADPEGVAWLRIEVNAGHTGADQVSKMIESSADQVAFLLQTLR